MTEVAEATEYVIPETWTPDHVARRLIEAFAIDRRLPRIERPKSTGSVHPQMSYTAEEMEEWEKIDIDPRRFAPRRDEIVAMERAFGWLLWLPDGYMPAMRAWALWRLKVERQAEKKPDEQQKIPLFCRGISRSTLFARRSEGLKIISDTLNSRRERVF